MLSFAGAALGASLSYIGGRAGTQQRETQGRREEWGRRFTPALDAASDTERRRHELGLVLLSGLAGSNLAGEEERRLAMDLLNQAARYGPRGGDLRLVHAGAELDALRIVQENGPSETDPSEGEPSS
ncbi:MAG: hypothetical protein QOK11_2727 [Pseudonocardiales bacterium]|nr:hypothetical protein [Pseudonocardiales bacterium]